MIPLVFCLSLVYIVLGPSLVEASPRLDFTSVLSKSSIGFNEFYLTNKIYQRIHKIEEETKTFEEGQFYGSKIRLANITIGILESLNESINNLNKWESLCSKEVTYPLIVNHLMNVIKYYDGQFDEEKVATLSTMIQLYPDFDSNYLNKMGFLEETSEKTINNLMGDVEIIKSYENFEHPDEIPKSADAYQEELKFILDSIKRTELDDYEYSKFWMKRYWILMDRVNFLIQTIQCNFKSIANQLIA